MTHFNRDAAEQSMEVLMSLPRKIGAAKRQAVLTEKMSKRIEALVMKKLSADVKSAAAQEREARASPEVQEAWVAEADAAGKLAELLTERDVHTARIEGWRSMEASARQASRS